MSTSGKGKVKGSPDRMSPRKGDTVTLVFDDDKKLVVYKAGLMATSTTISNMFQDSSAIDLEIPINKKLIHPALLRRLFEGVIKPEGMRDAFEQLSFIETMQVLDILDNLHSTELIDVVSTIASEKGEKLAEQIEDDKALCDALGITIDTTPEEQAEFRKQFFTFDNNEKGKKSPRKASPIKS